ncbi:MAG: hypothetical protein K0R24_1375 [Gammaproteobacteria bacterium]|nr:hypothetical protein [Gammaproteobacteria bacterium]
MLRRDKGKKEEEESWTCSKCESMNHLKYQSCVVCGKEERLERAPESSRTDSLRKKPSELKEQSEHEEYKSSSSWKKNGGVVLAAIGVSGIFSCSFGASISLVAGCKIGILAGCLAGCLTVCFLLVVYCWGRCCYDASPAENQQNEALGFSM